jgi:integrase
MKAKRAAKRVNFVSPVRVSELVHIEVGDVDLDVCKIFINRGKAPRTATSCFRRASAWCSKATCTPRRAIDIYSRLGGSGRSRHAESSKLCKAIARRPALRSRCTRCRDALY